MERTAFHASLALTAALAAQPAIAWQQFQAAGSGASVNCPATCGCIGQSPGSEGGAQRYRLKAQKLEIL